LPRLDVVIVAVFVLIILVGVIVLTVTVLVKPIIVFEVVVAVTRPPRKWAHGVGVGAGGFGGGYVVQK